MIKVLDVGQNLLDDCDAGPVEAVVADIEQRPEMVRMFQGDFAFHFPNHEERGVALWMDPAVRAWGRQVHTRIPHLLYYMTPDNNAGTMALVLTSFTDPGEIEMGTEEQVDAQAFELILSVVSERMVAVSEFARRMADDWRPIVTALVEPLSPRVREATIDTVEASLALAP